MKFKSLLILSCVYLVFTFKLIAGNATLIVPGSFWKYLDNGSDQGTAWYAPGFNDLSWAEGASELGYGDGGEGTVIGFGPDANNKYVTSYFRKTFNVSNPSILKSLLVGIRADDGAVIYLNGVEIARQNMPAGPIGFNTLAPGNIGGHYENVYHHFTVDPALLLPGANVIAVEVHQDAVNSSDLSFNLELLASTERTFIARGDEWKYLDNGSDQGTAWKDVVFPDGSWVSGKAILGYNSTAANRLENTTVSYGGNASNKFITTYFRKTITIADTSDFNQFVLNMYLDDGAVIYVNGVEANRINLPGGTIAYTTPATTAVGTAAWATYPINKSLFTNGVNVIAVEVHQQAITSSDMNFEMELMESAPLPLAGGGCVTDNIGCFTSLAGSCQSPGLLVLPSTHTFQVLVQQGDAYTIGGGTMPTNNDFTAYVPINNSSENGYLSINHENNPGGVSMLDMHYNPYTGLWMVDSSRAVSFSEVVKTERNCSGGITPWGTVVTSEEAVTGGDGNSDGYTDIGWHVEIDPETKQIVDYNNDGISDKCWALGRSTKENICFKNDSLTSYFGLDAGANSYIYKFVANQKADLSAGTLYVLRQNVYLGNTAYWVVVPNTTQADRNNCMSISTGLGATSFNKVEDVEIGPDGKIYFTSSNEGRVYRFSDSPSIIDFEIFIDKLTYTVNTGGGSSSALFNNCDNLAFDPIEGNLWVNVDGNCNYLWMARPDHTSIAPEIEIFARLPSGAESTGTTFSPDGRFMFFSMQHPSATAVTMVDVAGNTYTLNKSTTFVVARVEDLGPLAAIPFVELGSNINICQNETISIDAGAGHASYLWSNGAVSQTISVSTSGTYSVVVTGSNGRTNTDAVTVTVNSLPSAPSSSSVQFCFGDVVSPLNALGTNIKWYDDALLTTLLNSGNSYNTGITSVGIHDFFVTQTDANGCISTPTQVDLTIHSLPSMPVANNENVCEGLSIPSLLATGLNIEWYSDAGLTTLVNSGNSFSTGNTLAGVYTYYVTQTDALGCTSPYNSPSLTIHPEPSQPNISGTTVYCAGETIQQLTSSGSGINWYALPNATGFLSAGNNFTPSISLTDTFYVTSTSVNGCISDEASVVVVVNPLPLAPVSNDESTCFGSTVPSFTATGTGIEWFSDAGLTTSVGTGNSYNSGNTSVGVYQYYLTQTDANGCTSLSDQATLTIHSLPVTPIANNETICEGLSVPNLNATGSNVEWFSDIALTTQVASGNSFASGNTVPGTYTYYVIQTDANGCSSSAAAPTLTIYAEPTAPNVSGTTTYCSGETIQMLSSSGTGISWYASSNFTGLLLMGNNFTPSITATDTFYVSSTNINGCTSDETPVIVTIHSLPAAPVANDHTACFGGTIPALTSTGTGINWYSDAALTTLAGTGNTFNTGNTAAGVYQYFVTQTDANGCIGSSDDATLTIHALPPAPVISGDIQYCENENITALNATGTNVIWYSDSTLITVENSGNSFTPAISSTETFFVTATNNGCEGPFASVTVTINLLPSVNISGLAGSYIVTTSPVTISGTPAGGTFSGPGVTGSQFSPSTAGVGGPYFIVYQYTDAATGCTNSDTVSVMVTPNTGIITLENGTSINVFPNPSSDEMSIVIESTYATSLDMKLLDALGKFIQLEAPSSINSGKHTFTLSKTSLHLAEGTYYLQVTLGGNTSSIKLIFLK